MSVSVMNIVWQHAPVASGEFTVLLALADWADDKGSCFPSVRALASKSRLRERQVQNCLRSLEQSGFIEVMKNAGPNGSNRYRVNCKAIMQNSVATEDEEEGDSEVENTPETGGGANIAPLQSATGGVQYSAPGGCNGVHPNHHRTTIRTTIEREARERDEPEQETEDRRKLEARVKRLEQGRDGNVWPGSVGSSTSWAVQQFAALTEEQRQQAEERRDAYLAECRRQKCKPVAVGVYLRDRKFEAVEPEMRPANGMPDDYAPAFGPVWSAWRMAALIDGGKDSWIAVLDQGARVGRGRKFGDVWFALRRAMEPVTEGSAKWHAWRDLFDAKDWVWIPPLGNQSVAYFPKVDGADPPDVESALVEFMAERERAARDGGSGDGDGQGQAVQDAQCGDSV